MSETVCKPLAQKLSLHVCKLGLWKMIGSNARKYHRLPTQKKKRRTREWGGEYTCFHSKRNQLAKYNNNECINLTDLAEVHCALVARHCDDEHRGLGRGLGDGGKGGNKKGDMQ